MQFRIPKQASLVFTQLVNPTEYSTQQANRT
jgi:hypothetical protein